MVDTRECGMGNRGAATDVTEEAMDLIIETGGRPAGQCRCYDKAPGGSSDRGKVDFGSQLQGGHRPSRWKVHSSRTCGTQQPGQEAETTGQNQRWE